MSAPLIDPDDLHGCTLCGGDLEPLACSTVAKCDDCGALFALDWDMDGDSDGMHYTWGRASEKPVEVPK